MQIEIFHDAISPALCRSCHAPIVWVERVDSGKRAPYNPPLTVRAIDRRDGNRAIVVIDSTVAVSHFATCPQAKQWSRR